MLLLLIHLFCLLVCVELKIEGKAAIHTSIMDFIHEVE